jgi:hypothetical protein
MTDVLVYVALGASILGLGSLVVLMRYLPVLRRASATYVDSSGVVSDMLKELNMRASFQDRRLADAQVKLDILEDRWLKYGWVASQGPPSYTPPATRSSSISPESEAQVTRRRLESIWPTTKPEEENRSLNMRDLAMPSRVEALVLRNLVGRRLTAPEVKGVLGSSREHAARIMKSLADRGFVVRDTSKKPYSYSLSDVGRDAVTGNTSSGV